MGMTEGNCTCALVRRSARRITRVYDNALKGTNLRITQYSILAELEYSQGLSISDLAQLLAMDRTTLTRNLRPLQRDGLISLSAGADKRSKSLQLTDTGRSLLLSARPHWQRVEQRVRQHIHADELIVLHRLLDGLVQKLENSA